MKHHYYLPRNFDGAAAHGRRDARRSLAAELGCSPSDLVWWTHPDRDTDCLSLPDADGGEPWMEELVVAECKHIRVLARK